MREFEDGPLKPTEKSRDWVRTEVRVEGNHITVLRNGDRMLEDDPAEMPKEGRFCLLPQGAVQFANIFIKELP